MLFIWWVTKKGLSLKCKQIEIMKYFRTFLEEKGISLDTPIEVEGASGTNFMNVEVVLEHIEIAPKREQEAIRNMLIKIDFHNAPVVPFFKHLAKALAR